MPTYTANYNLAMPLVNNATDQDLWGGYLNTDIDDIDGLLRAGITLAAQASQTSSFTADASISVKKLYPCDATSGAIVATLPSAATAGNGATVYFKKTDSSSNAVTPTRAGSDTIDGAATFSITVQNSFVGLVSDGVSKWYVIDKVPVHTLTVAIQRFTTNGTYTPTTNMVYCVAEAVGSGGSGGGGVSTAGGASGGGGGEYGRVLLTAAQVGASQTVTIGAARTGGATGNDGTDGATTSLGSLLSCAGGNKGLKGVAAGRAIGGLGGTSAGAGDLKIPGSIGGLGNAGGDPFAGYGGNSYFGAGGNNVAGNNLSGNAGVGFGSGGGGAAGSGTGGSSTAGYVIITEYCFI